jgi:hypothetical protein
MDPNTAANRANSSEKRRRLVQATEEEIAQLRTPRIGNVLRAIILCALKQPAYRAFRSCTPCMVYEQRF